MGELRFLRFRHIMRRINFHDVLRNGDIYVYVEIHFSHHAKISSLIPLPFLYSELNSLNYVERR